MKSRFPWGRCIIAIPALLLLIFSINSAMKWRQMRFQCADAKTAVIAEFSNALGSIGTVETDFNPKYSFACKEMLLVEHSLQQHSEDNYTEVLKGLQAHVEIVKQDGTKALEADITDEWFFPFWEKHGSDFVIPAFIFPSLRRGNYKLRITVTQPAALLAGVPHKVKARYELCGIEYLQAAVIGIIALVAALFAFILISIIIIITLVKRRRARQEINT